VCRFRLAEERGRTWGGERRTTQKWRGKRHYRQRARRARPDLVIVECLGWNLSGKMQEGVAEGCFFLFFSRFDVSRSRLDNAVSFTGKDQSIKQGRHHTGMHSIGNRCCPMSFHRGLLKIGQTSSRTIVVRAIVDDEDAPFGPPVCAESVGFVRQNVHRCNGDLELTSSRPTNGHNERERTDNRMS